MKHIVALFAERPVTVWLLILSILAAGVLALTGLSLAESPSLPERDLVVTVLAPGRFAEELQVLVAQPLERALSDSAGCQSITSLVRQGRVSIRIRYHWGSDMDAAMEQCRDTLERLHAGFPQDVSRPGLERARGEPEWFMLISLPDSVSDPVNVSRRAEQDLLPRLRALEGVAGVSLLGAARPSYVIRVYPERLLPLGLDLSLLSRLLAANSLDSPAGRVVEGDREWSVRIVGRPQSPEDLAMVLVPSASGGSIRLGDIARIEEDTDRPDGFFTDSSGLSTALGIQRVPGANPFALSREVRAVCEAYMHDSGESRALGVILDRSRQLKRTVLQYVLSIVLVLAVAFVVLFFVQRPPRLWRCFCLWLAMPLSLSASLLCLRLAGLSLESLSLAGLTLAPAISVALVLLVFNPLNPHTGEMKEITKYGSLASIALAGAALVLLPFIVRHGPLKVVQSGFLCALFPAFPVGCLHAFLFLPALLAGRGVGTLSSPPAKSSSLGTALIPILSADTRVPRPLRKLPHLRLYLALAALSLLVAPLMGLIGQSGRSFLPEDRVTALNINLDWPSGTRPSLIEGQADLLCKALVRDPSVASLWGLGGDYPVYQQRHADPRWHPARLVLALSLAQSNTVPLSLLSSRFSELCARVLPGVQCSVRAVSHPLNALVSPLPTGGGQRIIPVLQLIPGEGSLPGFSLAELARSLREGSMGVTLFDIIEGRRQVPVRLEVEDVPHAAGDFRNTVVIQPDSGALFVDSLLDVVKAEQPEVLAGSEYGEKHFTADGADGASWRRDLVLTGVSALLLVFLLVAAWSTSLSVAATGMAFILASVLGAIPLLALCGVSLDAASSTGLAAAVAWLAANIPLAGLPIFGGPFESGDHKAPSLIATLFLLLAGGILVLFSREAVLRSLGIGFTATVFVGGLVLYTGAIRSPAPAVAVYPERDGVSVEEGCP